MKPFFSDLCASVSLWFKRLLGIFRRHHLDRDMAAEMRVHLDAQIERNVAAGMSPDDARAAAHRQFGGVAQIQERAREARGFAGSTISGATCVSPSALALSFLSFSGRERFETQSANSPTTRTSFAK